MFDYQKVDSFLEYGLQVSKKKSCEEAFKILTEEIEQVDKLYFNEYIKALNYIRSEKVLDWIEVNSHRIENVSQNWGHLAASSHFTWDRAKKWLGKGRPLSIVALDAMILCTTNSNRSNQSLWMRQINPKLENSDNIDIIAQILNEYKEKDSVPRVRNSVAKIISNLFNLKSK